MTLIVLVLAMLVVTLVALYRRHHEYIEVDDADIWAVTPPPPPHRRAA